MGTKSPAQAGVYVCFSCPGSRGGAGDVFLLQDEDSLLAGLELGALTKPRLGRAESGGRFYSF